MSLAGFIISGGALAAAPDANESGRGLTEVIAPYMGIFFIAFFAAFVLTPVMRMLAARNGIVDWPDLKRKSHLAPVAYLGGVAIFLGWLAGVTAGFWTEPHNQALIGTGPMYVYVPLSIVLGAAAVMFTGLFDDLYGISPRVKIGGQLFAAAALAWQRVGLELAEATLTLMQLPTPEWLVLLVGTTGLALFVIGGCNAFNLLDGLDGLAGGVTVIGCLGLLVMAGLVALHAYTPSDADAADPLGDPVRITMCLAILGALLGFLPYNFNPASIFMGDAGALLLGYLVVASILLFAEPAGGGPRLVTAALIIFALPITDTALAIFRRKMRGQGILEPDSEHLHHLLRQAGLSVRQSVAVLYGVAIALAVLGCTLVALQLRWRYVLAVFVVLFGFVLVTGYKYGERRRLLQQAQAAADTETPPVPDPAATEPAEDAVAPPSGKANG